jgi:hypothetical protein
MPRANEPPDERFYLDALSRLDTTARLADLWYAVSLGGITITIRPAAKGAIVCELVAPSASGSARCELDDDAPSDTLVNAIREAAKSAMGRLTPQGS